MLVSEEEAPRTHSRGSHLAISPLLPGAPRRPRARSRAVRPGASTARPTRSSPPERILELLRVRDEGRDRPRDAARDHPVEQGDRAPRRRLRSRPRPHRAELRPGAQRRVLRRAGRPRSRPPPGDRGRGLRRPGRGDPRVRRRRCSSASDPTGCWFSATRTARCRPTSPSAWGSGSSTWRPATVASTTASRRRSTGGSSTRPATCCSRTPSAAATTSCARAFTRAAC